MRDDEFMQLWQHATRPDPDPSEIARLAGRATMTRFDRIIFRRNFLEYVVGLGALVCFGWLLVTTDERRDIPLLGIACTGFSLGYLWWQHRDLKPLDPPEDARAYQSGMLARVDRQIRLLGMVRYWALPLLVWQLYVFTADPDQPLWFLHMDKWSLDTLYFLVGIVVVFLGVVWLNERSPWGVPRFRAARAKIQGLYGN